ncbi:MAG: alkaline phosphatase D family protein, partial [Saprospiraceae bacterium]|nr:alkaline phosphatase D family protein [Saprospiraceae bacterium]
MKFILPLLIAAFSALSAFTQTLPSRIAFGSCASQDRPQPILDSAAAYRPDLFIWLGDNIYGDTKDMDVLRAKYAKLAAKPEFQRLKKATRFLATWDDHDFGWNDSGRHYSFKKESREIFLDFWEEPANSPRRKHEGIYTSYYF